ncbi:MAG: tetratricopeptide repeat protein [Rhodobacteraceae bacterium]|nr:tetratricopeptide repeat protein [Paracoccaceae bacterium]
MEIATLDEIEISKFRKEGDLAFRKKYFAKALKAYQNLSDVDPDASEPFFLKGNALAARKNYEQAINEYDKAINNGGKPSPSNLSWDDWITDFNLATYFYNMGNASAALEKYKDAVDNYSETLDITLDTQDDLCIKLISDTYYNKGNSHFLLNEFDKAYESFSRSGLSSQAFLGMGNSKLKLKEYLEALENYSEGKRLAPKSSAVSCDKNALLVKKLINKDYSNPIIFIGNTGNFGNWGFGPGYKGLPGIEVPLN